MERVVFLDRDGVISEELGEGSYIAQWDQFRFVPGVLEAIHLLTENQVTLFIISNQGGVARGLVTEKELKQITDQMLEEIKKNGGRIQAVYYCIHPPSTNCLCRKPGIALFQKAVEKRKILWEKSIVVGDALRDLSAGRQLGCRTILVLTGKSRREDLVDWSFQPDYVAENLLTAVPWILKVIR